MKRGILILISFFILAFPVIASQYLMDQCTLFSGFSCNNFKYVSEEQGNFIILTFQNSLGYDMKEFRANLNTGKVISGAFFGEAVDCTSLNTTIKHGESIICGYDGNTDLDRIKGYIEISWIDQEGNHKERTGNFVLSTKEQTKYEKFVELFDGSEVSFLLFLLVIAAGIPIISFIVYRILNKSNKKKEIKKYSKYALISLILAVGPMIIFWVSLMLIGLWEAKIITGIENIPRAIIDLFSFIFQIAMHGSRVFPVLSLIAGFLGLKEIRKNHFKGKWMAISGIVVSAIFILIGWIFLN